ncbi:membrane or secreted protein [Neolewinella litorea]|uniref:Membrane or secreted protein n=1 Tax=Neolewinella litorea TaxID=2562452 RepID=A0A4S4NNN1_9BACT|nr:membrane or secreted protein [Neolewinella litorea]THH41616.1 membrane or secreted protein [Neolewinella litorea]
MKYFLFLLLLNPLLTFGQSADGGLEGAWQSAFAGAEGKTNELSMIIQDGYFVMTAYNQEDKAFLATLGGSYEVAGDTLHVTYEWDSSVPENVGITRAMPYMVNGSLLVFNNDKVWQRVDDGTGPLAGAWQITGRKQDGEMRRREPTGPRRTMKILSGSRFQWIAYNTETREMLGTGGGTYSADEPQYIERIEFFSRDPQRVGDQLSFDFKIRNDEWHHMGLSSKGDPIYETWGHRPPQ